MNQKQLTPKQRRLVDAIETYRINYGTSPTYRELMAQLGYRSTGSIYRFVQALKKKGLIEKTPRSWRSAHLTPQTREESGALVSIDVIGQVSKKKPPELLPKTHHFDVPLSLVGKDTLVYGLVIQDASFIDEHLLPGDLILVEPADSLSPGELVLASTQRSIIGHFFDEGETLRFRSSPYSSGGAPSSLVVRADETQVWGIIVGIIRAIGQLAPLSHQEHPSASLEPNEL